MIIKCISILVCSLLIFIFESYKREKKHRLSSFMLILMIYIMVAGNYQNADTHSFELTYNRNQLQTNIQFLGQWAYFLVINICNTLHFSFIQYRFVVYGMGFLALIVALRRVLENRYPFYLLYMIFPMIIDATQMKNFIAMCFITLAITYLIKNEKKDKILFALWILVAAGFHVVSYIYLPLVIICDGSIKKRTKYISVLPIVVFALLFSNRRMSAVLARVAVSNITDTLWDRTRNYFNSSVNNGYLIYFLATVLMIIIAYRLHTIIINAQFVKEKEIRISNVVFLCAIYSLVFLPLYFLCQDFSRLLRNLFPIYHIGICVSLHAKNASIGRKTKKGLVFRVTNESILLIAVYIMVLAYMFFWDIYGFMDTVLLPFFQYNSVLR